MRVQEKYNSAVKYIKHSKKCMNIAEDFIVVLKYH